MARRLASQPKKANKSGKSHVDQLAARYVQARSALVRGGGMLHDHVGSSLSAAGVQLQLLRMDLPEAKARIDETLLILEQVLDRVRDLTSELSPSPAYATGLKHALLRLAEYHGSKTCQVVVDYSATVAAPPEIAVALYEAGCAAVEQALRQGAARVTITVRGSGPLVLRIADDGKKSGRVRALSMIGTVARAEGLAFECSTGKCTIVSIRYAIRRSTRG